MLSAPNYNCHFKLAVDASNIGAGSVLLQEDENDHSVCYFSKEFNASQMNYSTIEKVCLSLILAVPHFEVYLTSSSLPIVVYSDHNPISFINKKNNNQRLMQWCLMLQNTTLTLNIWKGKTVSLQTHYLVCKIIDKQLWSVISGHLTIWHTNKLICLYFVWTFRLILILCYLKLTHL